MSFHPRMTSTLSGISVLDARHRAWNGIVADVWDVCCQDAEGEYESPDPRLFVALQMRGAGSFALDVSGTQRVSSSSITYVPAGRYLRSQSHGVAYVRHLDLHFDVATLRRQFGSALDERRLDELRVVFQDEQLLAICQLIAAECMNPTPLHSLYGDSLATALVAKLFEVREARERQRAKLSDHQLQLAMEFMENNFHEPVRLSELAALTGLSQVQFSRAFKETVGVPPHARLQEIRVRKVQEYLSTRDWPLTEIATVAGFADQAHLTRVFKRVTGLTPAYWARLSAPRRK